jgi:hypothetical protein
MEPEVATSDGRHFRPVSNAGRTRGPNRVNDMAKEFLRHHEGKAFPHSDELFELIRQDRCVLNVNAPRISAQREQMLSIYKGRAFHLAKFQTKHAAALRNDVESLCRALEKSQDPEVRSWIFHCPNGVVIDVFESLPSCQLLGSVKAISRLEVTEEQWKTLWGE